jgi:phosphomevalonate kinase
VLIIFQSIFSKFKDNTSSSYWNNYHCPQQYTDAYNNTKQNVTDNTVNTTRRINDIVLLSTESFNKSVENIQKYYNNSSKLLQLCK